MKLLWFKALSLCYPPRLFSHTYSLSRGSKNKPPAIHVSAPGLSHRLRSFPQNAFIIFQGSTTVFGNKGGFRDEPWGKWSRLMGRITLSPSSCSQGPELGLPKPRAAHRDLVSTAILCHGTPLMQADLSCILNYERKIRGSPPAWLFRAAQAVPPWHRPGSQVLHQSSVSQALHVLYKLPFLPRMDWKISCLLIWLQEQEVGRRGSCWQHLPICQQRRQNMGGEKHV